MNRVCINKLTGKLIEMQQSGDDIPELMTTRLDTLKQNAINSSYKEEDIEVKWVTDEEWAVLLAPDPIEVSNNEAITKLNDIDLKSIRPMREFLAVQFPNHKWTVNGKEVTFASLEEEAQTERAKLQE